MNFIPNTANQPHAAICVGCICLVGQLFNFISDPIHFRYKPDKVFSTEFNEPYRV